MQVRDVMGPVPGSLSADDLIRDASVKMRCLGLDPLPVTDGPSVVGMLSYHDLMDRIRRDGFTGGMARVHTVMSKDVVCCYADEDTSDAARSVQGRAVTAGMDRVPVLERDGRLVGVATLHNLSRPSTEADDGTAAVQAVAGVDRFVGFDEDRVEYMSDQSFPASDPPTSQSGSTSAPAGEEDPS